MRSILRFGNSNTRGLPRFPLTVARSPYPDGFHPDAEAAAIAEALDAG